MWIKASERVPPALKRVLVVVRQPNGNLFRCLGEYVPEFEVKAEDYLDWEDEGEVEIKDGVEYVRSGWYEWNLEGAIGYQFSGEVEWWCELPDLPDKP